MHAVIRRTNYAPGAHVVATKEFQEFQEAHAGQDGYQGTIVVEVDSGQWITLTLWKNPEDATRALETMIPVIRRTIEPLMTAPATLIGTGPVLVDDLTPNEKDGD